MFFWNSLEWSYLFLGFFGVFLYLLFRICPNCPCMLLFLAPNSFFVFCSLRRAVSSASTAAKSPRSQPTSLYDFSFLQHSYRKVLFLEVQSENWGSSTKHSCQSGCSRRGLTPKPRVHILSCVLLIHHSSSLVCLPSFCNIHWTFTKRNTSSFGTSAFISTDDLWDVVKLPVSIIY